VFVIVCTSTIIYLPWAKFSSLSNIRDRTQTHAHSLGLLWMSDQPDAETSTSQHTTLTIDRHRCPRWDSNTQSQQASGRRPTL